MNEDNEYYKRELLVQLDYRERELRELYHLKKDYENLQKRYYAISNSTLGKITFFYWKMRKRLNKFKNRV